MHSENESRNSNNTHFSRLSFLFLSPLCFRLLFAQLCCLFGTNPKRRRFTFAEAILLTIFFVFRLFLWLPLKVIDLIYIHLIYLVKMISSCCRAATEARFFSCTCHTNLREMKDENSWVALDVSIYFLCN